MKKGMLLGAAAAAVFAGPSLALADLRLIVENITVPPSASDFNGFIEVYFQETGDAQDEGLAAFNIQVEIEGGAPDGVRFDPPARLPVDHLYVFGPGDTAFALVQGSPAHVAVADDVAAGSEANIDNNEGVLRIPVVIPANTPEGSFPVTINIGNTAFSNAVADEIPFSAQDGTITIVPEPASLGLLGLGAVGLLRRRRSA